MAFPGDPSWIRVLATLLFTAFAFAFVKSDDIFLEWHVAINFTTIPPLYAPQTQTVITINGMFPGPLINMTTNDNVHINIFNHMDEPFLMTWNGIEQRLNSWQDGVSGTNCPIQPNQNWTYRFQAKDQIGSFSYFPSINFHKAAGGYGPIRINNRVVVSVPFPKPEAEFDLLIGDWSYTSFKDVRDRLIIPAIAYNVPPDVILINGKYSNESLTVAQGKTYLLRISNVGTAWSLNFRIQNHGMVLVETEGSYTNQIHLDSLDVHVGQSYSVLVTADQIPGDYYIVASPKLFNTTIFSSVVAVGLIHYENSITNPNGPLPVGPDPFDLEFSTKQAETIRWNLTTGAARPNPQGSFNVSNVTLSQTFILEGSIAAIGGNPRYTVNNVSYITPHTPLKLADQFVNGSGVYDLDIFPIHSVNPFSVNGTFVVTGDHNAWLEIVFKNDLRFMDSWHLDGFGFFVVGYGYGDWTPESRFTYNLYDPVVRSTVQVYPRGWSAVYVYLDNPGMWNLRSQQLKNWYLGQELYIRVYDSDPNPAKERPPPLNILYCGLILPPPPPPPPSSPQPPPAPPPSSAAITKMTWLNIFLICTLAILL